MLLMGRLYKDPEYTCQVFGEVAEKYSQLNSYGKKDDQNSWTSLEKRAVGEPNSHQKLNS